MLSLGAAIQTKTIMLSTHFLEAQIRDMLPDEKITLTPPKEYTLTDIQFEVVNIHLGQEVKEDVSFTFSATGRCWKVVEGGKNSIELFIECGTAKIVNGKLHILQPILTRIH